MRSVRQRLEEVGTSLDILEKVYVARLTGSGDEYLTNFQDVSFASTF